jgi:hypothetical protein
MRLPALLTLVLAGSALLLPSSHAGPLPVEEVAREADRGVLKIKNTTPYILTIFVHGVRAGWIKPYRTESFKGLKDGLHRMYAVSEYGSAAWGPRDVRVPGSLNVALEGKAAENAAIAMASRVFNANKSSLIACDKMADRRGEDVSTARVEFGVDVDAQGKGKVTARAEGASPSLASCYKTMASGWKYPVTGEAYQLTFSHVH